MERNAKLVTSFQSDGRVFASPSKTATPISPILNDLFSLVALFCPLHSKHFCFFLRVLEPFSKWPVNFLAQIGHNQPYGQNFWKGTPWIQVFAIFLAALEKWTCIPVQETQILASLTFSFHLGPWLDNVHSKQDVMRSMIHRYVRMLWLLQAQ